MKKDYPFILIDTQLNAIALRSDDIDVFKKILLLDKIQQHKNRKELYQTISEFLNGGFENETK